LKGLNLSFVAIRENGELKLKPLWNAPKYGFSANKPLPISEVIGAVKKELAKNPKEAVDPGAPPR
jgi:hypothetical protein